MGSRGEIARTFDGGSLRRNETRLQSLSYLRQIIETQTIRPPEGKKLDHHIV